MGRYWRAVIVGLLSFAVLTPAAIPASASLESGARSVHRAEGAALRSLATPSAISETASRPKPPKAVHVKIKAKYAYLTWKKVKGAKKYSVTLSKDGYFGPFVPRYTKKTSMKWEYKSFPYRDLSGRAYLFSVGAVGGKWATAAVHPTLDKFFDPIKPVTVTKKSGWKEKTLKLVKNCTLMGGAVATGTLVSGGVLAAAAMWFPPVEAVAWPTVAAVAAADGIGTVVACAVWGLG